MASNGRPDNQIKAGPKTKGGWERLLPPLKPTKQPVPKQPAPKRADGLVVRPILAR